MRYLYFFLQCVLLTFVAMLFFLVFSQYRYDSVFEKRAEKKIKTPRAIDAVFLGLIVAAASAVIFTWHKLYPGDPHHMGYFLAFFIGSILTLVFFRKWIRHIDLALCLPSIGIVWAILLVFEIFILANNAGWIYTDSTVLAIPLAPNVTIILENVIFFYVFCPFMSILIFTGLAFKRSDETAFFLANGMIGLAGVIWEYVCIAYFNLWTVAFDRSVLPINLFGAHTTVEELLYYLPFSSISILVYLMLYYRKYRYRRQPAVPNGGGHGPKHYKI
jgi:hypothetical protein